MAVHLFSFALARYLIGSNRYISELERAQFPRKFKILTTIITLVNVTVAGTALTSELATMSIMGNYYKLWIVADILMIFFAQINIYVEFVQNHKNDMLLAEYVYNMITDSVKKSLKDSIGSMMRKEEI